MILEQLLENDTKNCQDAINRDKKLAELETEFYGEINKLTETKRYKIENIFSQYMARIIRIAYVQGMKDLQELSNSLIQKDTLE